MSPKRSIRTKLVAITLAGIAGTLCASTLATSYLFDREYSRAVRANAVIVARNLRQQLERILKLGIPLDELAGFDEQCREAVSTHPDLAFALVVDSTGRALFASDTRWRADDSLGLHETLTASPSEDDPVQESTDGQFIQAILPINGSFAPPVGHVVVGVARELIWTQTRQLIVSSLFIGSLFMLTALAWTGFVLDRAVVRPLGDLLKAIRRLAEAPAGTTAGLERLGNDEIGIIGRTFNDMLAALSRTHQELQEDIAKRREAEKRLAQIAHFDELTDLPNRVHFLHHMEGRISDARRHGRRIALMFLDLDRFKFVNDTFGHPAGDQLLIEFAQRLRAHKRAEDLIARLGGDEFVVVIESLESLDVAAGVASQLITMLSEPVTVAGHEVIVTVSIGISVFPEDGDDLATVMKNADAAMYRAKAAGKNSYQFYSDDMRVAGLERVRRETELRRAVPNGELELRYQPVVSVSTRKITGVEALIRWQHPRLGLLTPSQFLPIAEESGLIIPIGLWAIQRSCIDGARLQALSDKPFRIAVNVSGTQLRAPQFPESVANALAASGLSPESLELEITEHTLLKDLISVRRSLEALRAEGVRFSIDDFGTGYSSLIHIKHLPVVRLKVDQSFVRDITIDPDDRAIVAAVVALAESLGLGVVAEGVETEDQFAFLARHDCTEVQGYLCGKPMLLSQVSALIAAQRENPDQTYDRAIGP